MKRIKAEEGSQPTRKKLKKPENAEPVKKVKLEKKSKFEKPTAVKKTAQPTEKPDWKVVKQQRKELKEKRKSKRLEDVYDVTKVAKKLGDKLRDSTCTAEERQETTSKLFKLLKGNFKKFIFTHDLSRVIQWLIKFSPLEARNSILDELKPELLAMWRSKYAINCVKKMLKYGDEKIRGEILEACRGHVVSIVSHSVSAAVFDAAYNSWASPQLKNQLKQEFYGDMYKHAKDDKVKCLSDVFKTAADMKSATLSAVKMNLTRVLNKNVVTNSLVQTVLLEFLSACSEEDRSEMIVILRSSIVDLSKTKDGSKIAMICIWHGTTKDRKSSLKSIKDSVKDIAVSEHGHTVLMSIFDSVDDTVLVKKLVLPEIIDNLKDVVSSEFGRKVILYLVARRDTHHFHPRLITELQEGDGNATSKKPEDIRTKELLEAVIDPLLDAVAEDAPFWMGSGSIAMVTLAILKAGGGEKLQSAFIAISEFLVSSKMKLTEEGVEYSVVEHPGLHMILKKLIQADKVLSQSEQHTFGEELVKKLDGKIIKEWIELNRTCFLLVLLLENESESVVKDLKSKLVEVSADLRHKKMPGASILLKKINT